MKRLCASYGRGLSWNLAILSFETADSVFDKEFDLLIDGTTVFGGDELELIHEADIDSERIGICLRHVDSSCALDI